MMKKYIQPEIELVQLNINPLMDGASGGGVDTGGTPGGEFDGDDTTYAPKWGLFDDDEEDEDEKFHTF